MKLPESANPWAIGLYYGASPLRLAPLAGNPVLSLSDVLDVPAAFLADPFMLRTAGGWHMVFEVLNRASGKGEIGLAESADGLAWSYRGIVLAEDYHLSYPYLFEADGEVFMVPETLGAGAVRLYRADPFPHRWSFVATLVDRPCADPSLAKIDGRWWLFACTAPESHDVLSLFSAPELTGPWEEHPASPLISGDPRSARPAGRIVEHHGRWIRYAQECGLVYGRRVRAFEILELTPSVYRERERPGAPGVEAMGEGWNGRGMHHVDPHRLPDGRWLACVDGRPQLPEDSQS